MGCGTRCLGQRICLEAHKIFQVCMIHFYDLHLESGYSRLERKSIAGEGSSGSGRQPQGGPGGRLLRTRHPRSP